jgi:hypothetical protein
MKPDVSAAMRRLIAQVRTAIPFDLSEAQVRTVTCDGCFVKLLDSPDSQLRDREACLDEGERPRLADPPRSASTGRKVHAVLQTNGLVGPAAFG